MKPKKGNGKDHRLVWEDPPPHGGPGNPWTDWREVLKPMTRRPNRWARITPPNRSAGSLRQLSASLARGTTRRPSGRWEFISRTFKGKTQIYARYLGPDPEKP